MQATGPVISQSRGLCKRRSDREWQRQCADWRLASDEAHNERKVGHQLAGRTPTISAIFAKIGRSLRSYMS
jgi:hypothetical protein